MKVLLKSHEASDDRFIKQNGGFYFAKKINFLPFLTQILSIFRNQITRQSPIILRIVCQLHLGVNQPCAIYSFEDIAYEITNSRKNRKNQFFGLGGVFIGSTEELNGTELCYIIPFTRSTRFKFDLLTLVYYHTTLVVGDSLPRYKGVKWWISQREI